MRPKGTKTVAHSEADTSVRDTSGLYSTNTLAEAIGVPVARICTWVGEGLLEPTAVTAGTYYFDFKQMSAAQTLRELADSGASVRKLRRGMKRLRQWLPDARPHERLVPGAEALRVRLAEGELADIDGQLRLEFSADSSPLPIEASPRTAQGWFNVGVEQYAAGDLQAAIEAYRCALHAEGADAKVAFALAHALAEAGRHEQAAERYLQVVELDPQNADAWNNLGSVLCALDRREDACRAYHRALEIKPDDAQAHYNLADTLDELGQPAAAASHWQAYLRHDSTTTWAAHARRRLTVG